MNYLTKIQISFDFKRISPSKSIKNLNDVGPSLVMASQVGFRMACQDNCLIRKMHVYVGPASFMLYFSKHFPLIFVILLSFTNVLILLNNFYDIPDGIGKKSL